MARVRAARSKGKPVGAQSDIQDYQNGKILPRTVSAEESFAAANSGNVMTQQSYSEDSVNIGVATVYHQGPGKVQMWKPGADGRYTPRLVANSSIQMLFKLGWKVACPDCGTNHEDSPYPAKDPNSCPGRPSVHWMRCPVVTCGKRLFDNLAREPIDGRLEKDAPDADAMIRLENTDASTPEQRLRHEYLMHMWHRHPRQAEMRNLPRLTADLMPQQPT